MKKVFLFLSAILLFLTGCDKNNISEPKTNEIVYERTEPKEIEISNFSTKLLSTSANRLNNIQLTCSKINSFILNNGEEFSFNKIVGKPSSDEGYKEADVIIDKKIIQAIGGRQLSS